MVKNLPANAGDKGSITGLGRSPGGGLGNPLQYSCLENPMDRGAWWPTVHGVTDSWTQLKQLSMYMQYIYIYIYTHTHNTYKTYIYNIYIYNSICVYIWNFRARTIEIIPEVLLDWSIAILFHF